MLYSTTFPPHPLFRIVFISFQRGLLWPGPGSAEGSSVSGFPSYAVVGPFTEPAIAVNPTNPQQVVGGISR